MGDRGRRPASWPACRRPVFDRGARVTGPTWASRTSRAIRLAVLAAIWLTLWVGVGRPARAANNPAVTWKTIVTPHFRITYHSGIEHVAEHVANISEDIYANMTVVMGHVPRVRTEVLLTDFAESANGSASALPYNALRLIVTAPEDLSPLGDVDDWYYELVTHEYTHILHTDNIHGIPALVNAVLGKTLAPNQVQPRWVLEGYAVHEESAQTSAGRMRNSLWQMFMRTDVLEGNIATIDQMSSFVRRWPQGNLVYVYGSFFTDWIARTHGEQALRATSRDYGAQIVPWGFNRSMRRASGKTYVELYDEWVASMKKQYGAQAAAVRAKGLRVGERLTHHGQIARYPRWIPDNAWPEHRGGLLYYRDDQHTRTGLVALDLVRDDKGAVRRVDEKHADLVARTVGESFAAFLPNGGVLFQSGEFTRNVLLYNDLESLPPKSKSAFGLPDGGRTRLTYGLRSSEPALSPDGRRVVFTRNSAGTRTLYIADLNADASAIANERPLVPSSFLEQAFTPSFSPDGTHVAYSVWKRGGFRDIRYVDVRDGSFVDLTADRATDGGPNFSADGRFLFFHSDRTGIMNVYALELATGRLRQVTNVLSGAYSPAPSPDGKTLAYVGYTKAGFDLFAIPLDESTWTEAEPYVDMRPPIPTISERHWSSRPYSAWSTILPRRYGFSYTGGSFGNAVNVTIASSDIAALHTVVLSSTVELEKPELQGALTYFYGRLPFDLSIGVSRAIAPRAGYQLGAFKPTIVQETTSLSSALSYTRPGAFDASSVTISHVLSRVGAELPAPIANLDPYETPVLPPRGLASSIHLGYSYTNAERYLYSVGPERGFSLSTSVDLTDPVLGSDFTGFVGSTDVSFYFLMPWLRHHSLAVHAGGGTSGGAFPGRGSFFIGGFLDLPVVDTVRNTLIQGGITLRGYPAIAQAGRSFLLSNAEYRFPIVNIDRGLSTLPILLNRITGNVFFDYGSAFDNFQTANFKSGIGAELWFDATLGYVAPFTFRIGYANGLASGGIDKAYFVAAVPY